MVLEVVSSHAARYIMIEPQKIVLRQNTGLTNDYEIVINQATNSSYRIMNATIQYFAQ
jgi:hypothetical protein